MALGRAAAQAAEHGGPEIAAVRAGFAGCYKVGVWTPLDVTVRGGGAVSEVRARATLADSDGVNCTFESHPCRVPAGKDVNIPLCVRFGRESSSINVMLLSGDKVRESRTFVSAQAPASGQFPQALGPGRRLVVSVGAAPGSMENALPNSEGKSPHNVIAAVDDFTGLPIRSEGYEGVDFVVLSTSQRGVLAQIAAQPVRLEALDLWVRAGGTLVLCAGANAEQAIGEKSPLARFVPGRFETVRLRPAGDWEAAAKSLNKILPGRVKLPTAKLADVRGRIEAGDRELPLVVRAARGLGQIVFTATDLDSPSMRTWSDRPLLLGAILGLPVTEPPPEAVATESFGYDDLAGQLRSALEQFRGVRLSPFYLVATLAVVYILLIGPADYFLLRRLRRGMIWTWLTFPAVVAVFVAGGFWASSWLKRDAPRVDQVDLIDVASDGTARGASWFSIFSPRAETLDLSLHPRLPDGNCPDFRALPGQPARKDASRENRIVPVGGPSGAASLAWFGKAGNGFNGMYNRDMQNAAPLGGEGYRIAPAMDAARDVPIAVWSCKNFVYRWLGQSSAQGVEISLQEESRQPAGTIVNRLTRGGRGVTLEHAYLACDGWAYLLGTLRPGETVEINSATRRVRLNTFMSSESSADGAGQGGQAEKTPYDAASRDSAYVLRAMLFYDSAGGRRRTGLSNDYQGFTDLSGVFRTGCAVLVAMPPQEEAFRGAEVLRSQQPLCGPLDRHTIVYRFVAPVGKGREP